MSRPRAWGSSSAARSVQSAAIAMLAFVLSNCAIAPNGLDDPIGARAAFERCFFGPNFVKPEDRMLPNWFSIFGPALACR